MVDIAVVMTFNRSRELAKGDVPVPLIFASKSLGTSQGNRKPPVPIKPFHVNDRGLPSSG